MTIERRIQDALRNRVADVRGSTSAWDEIIARLEDRSEPPPRPVSAVRRVAVIAAALVTSLVALLLVWRAFGQDHTAPASQVRCLSSNEPGLITCPEAVRIADSATDVAGKRGVTAELATFQRAPGVDPIRVWFLTLRTRNSPEAGPSVEGCRLVEQRIVLDAHTGRYLAQSSLEDQRGCQPPRGTSGGGPGTGRCDGHVSLVADLDADGRPDLVYHDWVRREPGVGEAELGVCTGAGLRQAIPGSGQSELLEIIDVQNDGRDEIFFGGTTVSAQFYEVAILVEDQLQTVRLPNGTPLVLISGLASGEELGVGASAFGCEDSDGDGVVDLVRVAVTRKGQRFAWLREAFAVQNSAATPGSVASGTRPAKGGDMAMLELARSLVSPCEIAAGE